MLNHNEVMALREYAECLEKQNQAKTIEQQTLYRQLEALETEVKNMEKYYFQNKQLIQQISSLKSLINAQQHDLKEAEQGWHELDIFKNENNQLQQHLNLSNQRINELEDLSSNQTFQIQRLQHELASMNHKYNLMQRKREQILVALQEKQQENQALKQKIMQLSHEQNQQTEKNLHQLAQNYEKIELVVLQKQEIIQEMETYIDQLEHQCQFLNQEFIKVENYSKKLENEVKCLQMRRNVREMPEDNLSFLTDSISKVDLMRQNNRMLERIVKYEKENSNNDNLSQRGSYSECGQGKSSNSPSKLQMRIHTLKMENQNLLRTLAI